MKLRTRITIWLLAIIVVAGFSSYFAIVRVQHRSRLSDFEEFASVLAQTVHKSLRQDMMLNRRAHIPAALKDLGAVSQIEEIRVYSSSTRIAFSAVAKENNAQIRSSPSVRRVLETAKALGTNEEHYGVPVYSVLLPVKAEPQCRSCHSPYQEVLGVIEVGLRSEALEQRLRADARMMAILMAVISAVLLVSVLIFLRGSVVERVRAMMESISTIAAGDYGARVEVKSRDELGQMAQSFNEMASRIQSTIHELGEAHRQLERSLTRFGKLLATTVNISEIADLVVDELSENTGAVAAALFVRHPDDTLVLIGKKGLSAEIVTAYNSEPAYWGEPPFLPSSFATDGILLDSEQQRAEYYKLAICHQSRSFYVFPLVGSEKMTGLLTLVTDREMSGETRHGLEFLCREAATAIENALLHETLGVVSITDELTQTYNQRHLFASLKEEISRADRYGRTFALVLLDLDKFKLFNDSFGHLTGDKILRRVAQLIVDLVRTSDRVFRYGGDEFVLLLPDTDAHNAMALAARVKAEINVTDFVPEGESADFHLGASMGVVAYDRQRFGGQEDLVFKAVDDALYEAKKQRDRVVLSAAEVAVAP